jgi:hypothetical protein
LEIERLIGDDALELAVLLLQRAQPLRLAHLQAAIRPPPPVKRLARDRMPANHVARLAGAFRFLQDRDDLLVGKSALAHSSPPRRAAASGTVNL